MEPAHGHAGPKCANLFGARSTSLRGRSQAIASNRVNRQTKGLLNNGRNLSDARRGTLIIRRNVQAEAPGQRHLVRFGAILLKDSTEAVFEA